MTAPSYRMIENRKFMWDGATYPDEAEASRIAATYREARFDVRVVQEEGAWLVFTRREAAAEAASG